ncbi:MAG: hypothetical protein HY301_18365 [Verrucomicrobia bacterium]|nr:hypothetical protein [Verrucomicrobiota bacterium]
MNLRTPILLAVLLAAGAASAETAAPSYDAFDQPPHNYWQRPLKDRFSLLKDAFESGKLPMDRTSERTFVTSLLRLLAIPASSQMWVFSTTSLQLSLISPRNPRALYFTDDVYLGYIPGGRIEIVSLDPELGGIYYIFDIPRGAQPIHVERATRCMNCHAGEDTGHVPGIDLKSVVPGPRGGSLNAFRQEQTGHQIPLEQRFGGWHVTGAGDFTNHWGNLIGNSTPQGLVKIPVSPGTAFDMGKYPATTSDLLPLLLMEHQAGFVNRAVGATYRARTHLATDAGRLTPAHAQELDEQADALVRYTLFADEAKLPPGGVEGDATFKADFLRSRRAVGGAALKDFDLRTRLFKHRCSYMIYSPVFAGLPPAMKQRVYARLGEALSVTKPDAKFAYLAADEKQSIRAILKGTLKDLPSAW